MEETLLLIKPDAVERGLIGEILSRIEKKGFKITGLIMRRLSKSEAEEFYCIHKGKDFFYRLVEFISSGPIVAVRLEGDNVQLRLRELVGATDPSKAQPGTIRYEFGTSVLKNAVHAANPEEDVNRELNLFFSKKED